MKIIFTQQVNNHNPGEVKDVADGYARNFLLPRGLAIPATDEAINNLEASLEKKRQEEDKELSEIESLAKKIESREIKVKVKVGPKNIFGSITSKQIAGALVKEGIEVKKQAVLLSKPIKELGEFSVPIKLSPNKKAYAKIVVEKG